MTKKLVKVAPNLIVEFDADETGKAIVPPGPAGMMGANVTAYTPEKIEQMKTAATAQEAKIAELEAKLEE